MFLISTTQRCGSTWLTHMVRGMAKGPERYINGLRLGFRLHQPNKQDAIHQLAIYMRRFPATRVFKTHDIAARDFDAICAALPAVRILTIRRDFRDVVISRYFYLRYHWPTNPTLGQRPKAFEDFIAKIGSKDDDEALAILIGEVFTSTWAKEWKAFETEFTTPSALRLTYEGMLDESEFPALSQFLAMPIRKRRSFQTEQIQETESSGRNGKARFFRKGSSCEWREWFNYEQSMRLMEKVSQS